MVELVGVFFVDAVSAIWHHREGGGGDVLFHEDTGRETRPVFVAGEDKGGDGEVIHFSSKVVERGSFALDAFLGVGGAEGGVGGEAGFEFGEGAGVFVFELDAGGAVGVAVGEGVHVAFSDEGDGVGGFFLELG